MPVSRRQFLIISATLLTALKSKLVMSETLKSHEVLWGGIGFNRPAKNLKSDFPYMLSAIKQIGGLHKLADKFVEKIQSGYEGGITYDKYKKLKLDEIEGALIFHISFDDEYLLPIPSGQTGSDEETVTMYLFAQSKVMYLRPSSFSGESGELKVIYNYPFRVAYTGASKRGDNNYRINLTKKAIDVNENSLVNVFGREISEKSFREIILPNTIKVDSVSISSFAKEKLNELKISQSMDNYFWGQALTSSLAMNAKVSIEPFRSNRSLGKNLAERFDQSSKVMKIVTELDKNKSATDYSINLSVHKILRKSNGSSSVNVLYTRGMSAFIEVVDNNFAETVFNKKIHLVESHELPKHNFDLLKYFDEKYMIQIAIKMFDTFAAGILSGDSETLAQIGLKDQESLSQALKLKKVFQKCHV